MTILATDQSRRTRLTCGLADAALEDAAAKDADALRETTGLYGVGFKNEGIVLGYGTLLDVARGELFRRHLKRSERLARLSLGISIGASVVTTTLAISSVVIATSDPSPERIVEVRERLPADAGGAELNELEQLRANLRTAAAREQKWPVNRSFSRASSEQLSVSGDSSPISGES